MTWFFTLFAAITLMWQATAPAAQTSVFAAASLRDVLAEVAQTADIEVSLSSAGSGQIARQVVAGAPADVVVLAHEAWMDWLTARLPSAAPSRAIAENRLVLIGTPGQAPVATLADAMARLGDARLAMGHRSAVPAGLYAAAWLRHEGLWDNAAPRLAETDNVRAALTLVQQGQTSLGIVYQTDALSTDAVETLLTAPAAAHPPIRYWAAPLTAEGVPFVDLLLRDAAQEVFQRHGFVPIRP